MNPLQSLRDYEEYVYTLRQRFPVISRSTLVIVRRGKRTALLQGEIVCAEGYRITLKERLSCDNEQVVIEDYGYEIWRNTQKLAWYDAQPHPNDPTLASTYPHHKHIPPDIKHHRIPAPDISFMRSNLESLLREVQSLINEENK